MSNILRSFIVVWIILFVGCSQSDREGSKQAAKQDRVIQGENVLAYVNDVPITAGDVERRLEMVGRAESGKKFKEAELQRVLEELIDEELLLQEAKRQGLDKDADIQERVKAYEKRLIIEKLEEELSQEAANVNEETLSSYYESHRDQFDIPPMLKLRQIVVVDKVTADNLYKKLTKDDGSFAEMARRYSVDTATNGRGGVIGVYRKGTKQKAFEDAAYGIKEPMQFAPVFQTGEGYHVLQLLERREGVSRSFEQVKTLIRRRMAVEKEKALLEDLLTKLKEKSRIKMKMVDD